MTDPARRRPGPRATDLVLVAGFVGALWVPVVSQLILSDDPEVAQREFRVLSNRPVLEWDLSSLRDYPDRFDAWFGDSFGARERLLRWHHVLKWFGFGVSPTERLVLGRDDWLFYAGDRSIPVYRGVDPLTEAQLSAWKTLLEERRDALAREGIEYLYVLAPNKNQIYSEYLPDRYAPLGPTRLDQLLAYLDEHSSFSVLDLRPALLAAKQEDTGGSYLYTRFGTHWSARGHVVAYTAIVQRLAELVPGIEPFDPDRFLARPTRGWRDSWGGRMYMEDMLQEETASLELRGGIRFERLLVREGLGRRRAVRGRGPDPDAPRLTCFHDSYLVELRNILARHFGDASFYWDAPYRPDWIAEERPDVVLEVRIERELVTCSPFAERWMDQDRLRAAFKAPRAIRFRPDSSEPVWGVESYREAVLEQVGKNLSIRSREGAGILIPAPPGPDGERLVMRLVFVAPAATELRVLYQTVDRPGFGDVNIVRHPVVKGRNDLYLELADPDRRGRLLIQPGAARGRYLLRSLEIRAVAR
jgi:hypothetical protein